MTKAADFEKAWRLAYMKTDYSLIEPMIRPDYRCFDYRMGMEVDFEAEKSLMETISPFLTVGPWETLYENDEVYVASVFSKYNESQPRFIATMATAKLIESKIYRHEIIREVLDYDPAETRDWNWEDYE
mgnify:CR=1 FL=1|jgi:hypothetical protein